VVHYAQTVDRLSDSDVDTIVAIATPAGIGGIGIVRVSGPDTASIVCQVIKTLPAPRVAHYCAFTGPDDGVIDRGVVLYFPAPNSYTGDDVAEFQCHGGPVIVNMLLAYIVELGARTAEPGEFTRRAFLNNKLDLTQAEAVCDLINSKTRAAARAALRSLDGELSRKANQIRQQLLQLRMYVEAAIDFAEEEIDFLDDQAIVEGVTSIRTELAKLIGSSAHGRVLHEGLEVAIAGLPNAGKSSLLNQLAGQERAIVTPEAGTTRDSIDLTLDFDGIAVNLTDTAGLRSSDNQIEREGIARAWTIIQQADLVLYLIDVSCGLSELDRQNLAQLSDVKVLVAWNKIDLDDGSRQPVLPNEIDQVSISARHAIGLDAIRQYIQNFVGFCASDEGLFVARRRHLEALENARRFTDQAHRALQQQRSGELAAQDLSDAMLELGKLVGTVSAHELLGEIFANFCIGK